MPRKNAMRDNVNAVRSRLPYLSDLPREKIELALLYYESNVDATVEGFNRNGVIEALDGWTEISKRRRNNSARQTNNKPLRLNTTSSLQVPPSNGILRPSQRVSNIFQTFAEGGTPIATTNACLESTTMSSTTTTCLPSSSFTEQSDNNLQSNSYLSHDSTTNHPEESTNISTTTINDVISDEIVQQQKPIKSQRRKSIKNRNSSTSSITQNHEPSIIPNNQQTVTTSSNPTTFSNNKKLLTKSVKDLQRQTSTLTNVELLFNNEIKSSIKRIDDLFKQIREIIKEREVELYLEMDQVKEQGLNVIQRRQQRAVELRQRIDRCDRLEPLEIDHLRNDIKQFVTDRRYDLGEELTSSHRFEYDQTLMEALKNFGTILKIDRRHSTATITPLLEANSTATISPLLEANSTTTTEKSISDITSEQVHIPVTNSRTVLLSSSSNEVFLTNNQQQPLPQRINNNKKSNGGGISTPTNGYRTGDYHQNSYSLPQTNGYIQYYGDTNYYQNANRRRPQQYFQRPILNYQNGNNRRNAPKQLNGRGYTYNNSEPTNTYHHPRPPPPSSRSIVPV